MRRNVLNFMIVGGLLVPLAFTGLWLLVELLLESAVSKNEWLVNIQQVQVMVWPSSVIQMAAPEQTFNVIYFGIAVSMNVLLYGAFGFAFAWLSKSPVGLAAFWFLCSAPLMALALFWGQSVSAGILGAFLVGCALLVFWRYKRPLGA